MKASTPVKFIVSIVGCELLGAAGALVTTPAVAGWYAGLAHPPLTPPNGVFGPVWTLLFALLGISVFLAWKNGWRVVNPVFKGRRIMWSPLSDRLWNGDLQEFNIVTLFWLQCALNVLWSVLFFGFHATGIAFFELVTLWYSIVYLIINFYRVSKTAAWLLVPYFLWVGFAAYLNLAIWLIN